MRTGTWALEERVPPFRDLHLGEQVMLALSIAAGEMGTRIERILREREPVLTHARYNILRMLRGAGDAGLSCSEIGERLLVSPSDVTRLINPLAEGDYVLRVADPDDRRVVLQRLTRAGTELLADLDRDLSRVYEAIAAGLGDELAGRLVRGCEQFIAVARDLGPPGDEVGGPGREDL